MQELSNLLDDTVGPINWFIVLLTISSIYTIYREIKWWQWRNKYYRDNPEPIKEDKVLCPKCHNRLIPDPENQEQYKCSECGEKVHNSWLEK